MASSLVWSPTTSLPDLLQLINGARHLLLVENEEMDNTSITNALTAAARRGVKNFSTESLRYNRELGILMRGSGVVGQMSSMVQQDFNGAARWR